MIKTFKFKRDCWGGFTSYEPRTDTGTLWLCTEGIVKWLYRISSRQNTLVLKMKVDRPHCRSWRKIEIVEPISYGGAKYALVDGNDVEIDRSIHDFAVKYGLIKFWVKAA